MERGMIWFARLPFVFIVFLMMMVLLLGASAIYGEYASKMTNVLFIYAIMLLLAQTNFRKTQHKGQQIVASLGPIFIAFLGTLVMMAFIQPLISGVIVASTLEASLGITAAFGLVHAFVKAYIEEEVFRGRLSALVGEPGQAILFGVFHVFVLYSFFGFSVMLLGAMAWLTALGYVWGRVEDWGGLAASTGSHFAYNLVVMGIGAVLFGAVAV
jgi:hypothetical protein